MRSVLCVANVTFALAFSMQSCTTVEPPREAGSRVGSRALEIAGEDLDGALLRLSDYRGKVVVLDFWGDW
jgi:hypothetical protein